MEFTWDFNWKDYINEASFRTDKSEVVSTSRVNFSGFIGTMDQNTHTLHNDLEKSERQDFGEVKFSRDNNGRLIGRAVVTTIGVYPYIKEDGKVQWELRHPDDVYDFESLKTLELLPLTNDHPTERVTKDNVKDLQVGQFGEFVLVDTMHGFITNKVVVAESEAVQDVENGKRALSMGYSTDVIPESGVWNGIPYDAKQTNIRYNHGSIVNRGRAGDDAVMKFDSFDGIQTAKKPPVIKTDDNKQDTTVINTDVNTDEGVTMGDKNLRTVKLDGVDYEAEPAVITALTKANEKLDSMKDLPKTIETLKADLAKAEGERDSFKEKQDALQKEVDGSIKTDQLEGLFQKRQKLDEAVSLAKIEDADKLDVKSKMEAVVLAVSPDTKEVLDARKDSETYMVYLESRFDSAVESLKKDETVLVDNLSLGTGGDKTQKKDKTEIKTDDDVWNQLVHASDKKAV